MALLEGQAQGHVTLTNHSSFSEEITGSLAGASLRALDTPYSFTLHNLTPFLRSELGTPSLSSSDVFLSLPKEHSSHWCAPEHNFLFSFLTVNYQNNSSILPASLLDHFLLSLYNQGPLL